MDCGILKQSHSKCKRQGIISTKFETQNLHCPSKHTFLVSHGGTWAMPFRVHMRVHIRRIMGRVDRKPWPAPTVMIPIEGRKMQVVLRDGTSIEGIRMEEWVSLYAKCR
ncbi:uncharacterized protein LOC131875611 [Cryptomeria japonica]|uniref:uncharacterized protein LOC131875611 n=1 Tax=Cryptomeria japonica TaxID=3369 RepID=UPI0027DA3A19|nr:uncharacterized protein LOC131875611 [Cryptomeria japonica]